MLCVLMNKNTEVMVAEYDEGLKAFTNITEIKNVNYVPYILKKYYDKNSINDNKFRIMLSDWFKGRGIPYLRDKLDLLLHRLNIATPEELLDKAFGMSLSDQYWIRPYDSNIKYDDINFFDHDFEYAEFQEASLSLNSQVIAKENSLKTPNNTTDGMLKKAWVIEDKTRYLLKSGYKNDVLQPFNEVLASMICERLGFDHVLYTLEIYNNMLVSKCPCFVTKDTELITANQIINGEISNDCKKNYDEYVKILESNGINKAREKLENMYILDYIIMNEDRHLNNFGIIRDVNTLKWLDVAPIFDNGQSLNIIDYNDNHSEIVVSGYGRLFFEILPFDEIIKIVKNIKRIDIAKLDGIVDEFDKLLRKYRNITNMSDKKISSLCTLLSRQINKLDKMIKNG